MSWVFNGNFSRSNTPGAFTLNDGHQCSRRNVIYSSSPASVSAANHTMCSRVTAEQAIVFNSSLSSLPALHGHTCLPLERPPRQPYLNRGMRIEQVFNMETNPTEPFGWCFTDNRPDFTLNQPTTPKRRRTSTGSISLLDYAYFPASREVAAFENMSQVGLSVPTTVSAILTSTMPTVQLVHGGWPQTTVCLQPAVQHQHGLAAASSFINHIRSRTDSGPCQVMRIGTNGHSNYASLMQHNRVSNRYYLHQRKRHCGRARHETSNAMASSASYSRRRRIPLVSTEPNNPSSAVPSRLSQEGRSSLSCSNSSTKRNGSHKCLNSVDRVGFAGSPSVILSSVENRVNPDNSTNFEVQQQSNSQTVCSVDTTAGLSGLTNREVTLSPERQNPNNSTLSNFPMQPCGVDTVSVTSPITPVAALDDLASRNSLSLATEGCHELEDATRTLSNTLRFSVASGTNPRADEATVVAAAAVASAAAHAVAAAAQAVSAAVHRRHGSNLVGSDTSSSTVRRQLVNRSTSQQLSTPCVSSNSVCIPSQSEVSSSPATFVAHIPAAMVNGLPVEQTPPQPLASSLSGLDRSLQNPIEFGTSTNISQFGLLSTTQLDQLQRDQMVWDSAGSALHHNAVYPNATVAVATQAAHAVAAAAAAQVAAAAASVVSSSQLSFLSNNLPAHVPHSAVFSHPTLVASQFVSPGLVVTPNPMHLGSSLLAVPSTPPQNVDSDFLTVPTEIASVAAVAAVAAAVSRAATAPRSTAPPQMTATSICSPRLVGVAHPVCPDRSRAQPLLIPRLSIAPQVSSVPVLPLSSSPFAAMNQPNYSNTRDIQTLFQFLRLINQRQDPYALPYYPSAMTAMAGVSNPSVVVSASMGNSNGSRVASAVTPPLAPHHPTLAQPTTLAAFITPNLVQQSTSSNGFVLSAPTTEPPRVHPTSSTAVALAAVAMAAAAALQQQTNHHIPANVMSMLSGPPAAPTPSIPVPILHAQSYYPLNTLSPVPVSRVAHCHHLHHGANSGVRQQRYDRPVFTPVTTSMAAPPAYSNNILPFFVTVPASPTHTTTDPPDLSSALIAHLASNHLATSAPAPVLPAAAAALAAAAEAAAASVDTLYQLAVQLESSGRRGLTKEELDSLPVRLYGEKSGMQDVSDTASSASEDRCMICLDDYGSKDLLRSMRCSHEFHASCVDKWLKSKRTCPLCRADAFDGTQHKEELF